MSEERVKELEAEAEMFKVYLKEAALTHAYAAFKSEYRRRLQKQANAETIKAKMKAANDAAAAAKAEVVEEEEEVVEELTQCSPGVQLPELSDEGSVEEAEEDNDEFTDADSHGMPEGEADDNYPIVGDGEPVEEANEFVGDSDHEKGD